MIVDVNIPIKAKASIDAYKKLRPIKTAFKPNGITDNREEWRDNMDSLKFWNETWPEYLKEIQRNA